MGVEAMTPKQRFLAALNGEALDRPCAASITSVVNFELMDIVGSHFPEANTDPEPIQGSIRPRKAAETRLYWSAE